jgi:Protein of unknown function (DUF1688)
LTSTEGPAPADVRSLLSAAAVRSRAQLVLAAGRAGKLAHFAVHEDRLDAVAEYVAATIRQNYPSLDVPPHARWRHFVVGGVDRWQAAVANGIVPSDRHQRARMRFEIAITSVLLDAGAGPAWRWQQVITTTEGGVALLPVARSEGLALASLNAYASRLFQSDQQGPIRADAAGLSGLTREALGKAFQVRTDNPLEGLDGRVALLNRLGGAISARPELFGKDGRLGGLFDTLTQRTVAGRLPATAILELVLEALGSIWPGRLRIDGMDLGDTWRHPAIDVAGPTRGLMPFHKLSQWLSYSLIEPLQEFGIEVTDLDGLTGLAEYRNGGLFLDLGVIVPRDASLPLRPLQPGDEPIVEWRALTVALLDEIAPLVRAKLKRSAEQMPLASVLEGGTWAAGRRIAAEKRAGGGPPLTIVSDGSVF